MSFAHLNVHSEYSLVDSIINIKQLVNETKRAGMSAVALTDQNNLFAAIKFYTTALAEGIKPIFGAEILISQDFQANEISRCILLCQTNQGYYNLIRLVSKAYQEGQHQGKISITYELLLQYNEGLIVLSGAQYGDIGQALLKGNIEQANTCISWWKTHFANRFYIECQRIGHTDEINYIPAVINMAYQYQIPVVATNAVRFVHSEDFEAHEARVCINSGYVLTDPKRPKDYTEAQWLRTPEEMKALFHDIPSAIQNAEEIVKRCNVVLRLGEVYLPDFPVPNGMTIKDYFAQQALLGLEKRLAMIPNIDNKNKENLRKEYLKRLRLELDVINNMGFAGYFLIVADFIAWSKKHNIPVGPGRGSGAGSLVAYSLFITELDPISHGLLFERFLNPERVSMPDFDIDFCMDGRDQVIDYVAKKYGRECVSQIITYGSMAAKAVIRDVGRVLSHPYGFVDKIAKMIPFEIGMTLEKALAQEESLAELYKEENEVTHLIDLALKLEGTVRNVGKHAGGVVIAPSCLTDFSPIYCEPDGTNLVTQFDKDDVEKVGLVKFDFLGLRTLTIINWTVQSVNVIHKKAKKTILNINDIPIDDEKTFDLLKACTTTAVFQLESRGMKDLIKRLQPDCFDEIVALVALFRPGPLQSGMVDDFIDRKHGRAKVVYPHPSLEPILKSTYGVILYQEQVMQIAQVLSGYTLGGADILRRAMGKKKPEEMAKQREVFIKGAEKNQIASELAESIFDLIEKFAGYGFNKSHSAAYALLSYQTAWLKAQYPAYFMASVLSSDMDNTDKIVTFIQDCRQLALTIHLPSINQSHYKFTAMNDNEIRYGLGAIKGVGEAAIAAIIEEREKNGDFTSLFDFSRRLDLRKVNKRVTTALIYAGAMDGFSVERSVLFANLEKAYQQSEQESRDKALGQHDLFTSGANSMHTDFVDHYTTVPAWSIMIRLQNEFEALGHYLSGHPMQCVESELKNIITAPIKDLKPSADQTVLIAGLVTAVRVRLTKKGDKIAFVTLDDNTAQIDIAVFTKAYQSYAEALLKDTIIVVEGTVSVDDFSGGYRVSAEVIYSLIQAREHFSRCLLIKLDKPDRDFVQTLRDTLMPYKNGRCPVCIDYKNAQATARVMLGAQWYVEPNNELLASLKDRHGDENVFLVY